MSPIVVGDELPGVTGGGAGRWDLYLARSSTMEIIAPLPEASGMSLDLTLNRPGRLSFNFPLNNVTALEFSPINRCVILAFDGQFFWSGPIWSFQQSLPDENMSVVCVGWQELLYHRVVRSKTIYTAQTRGQIIFDLLATANAQQTTWISQGSDTDDAPPLDKTVEAYESVGAHIEEMTSIEAGPDIIIDPEFRTLHVTAWDQYVDRPSVIWAYGWGPENVESFQRNIDGSSIVNRLTVFGKNTQIPGYLTNDTTSQNQYQLFESSLSLSSVSDTEILAAYGEAEIIYKGNPRVTYNFQPMAGNDQPLVFRDFQLGDKCYLKAKFGNIVQTEQAIRIFSCNLSIDENSTPKMSNMVTVAA